MRVKIVQGRERLVSHSGISLVGEILARTRIRERLDKIRLPGQGLPEISHGVVVAAMLGLMCLGKPDFDAVEPFRDDAFFTEFLGRGKVPSSSTLRQRLNSAKGAFDDILLEESAKMVRDLAPAITPCYEDLVAIDIDVSPFDNSKTKKEDVSWTYKGFDGYSPIFANMGEEGYLINLELRPGSDHCQNGTAEFLENTLYYARTVTDAPLLLRMDSGNDALDNIKVCLKVAAKTKTEVYYLIKRNLRKESKEEWLQLAMKHGELEEKTRLGKRVWRGDHYVKRAGVDKPLRIVFRVTQRTIDPNGQALLIPTVEVATYWTSLAVDPTKVIKLYHAHATSEQFHSELKTDMDLERLPSGKFQTNDLVLRLGMVAYNIMRIVGQESLQEKDAPIRKRPFRRRIRSVMQDLIYLACRLVKHSGQWTFSFGRHCPWFTTWRRVYIRMAQRC